MTLCSSRSWNRPGFRSLLLAVLITPIIINLIQILFLSDRTDFALMRLFTVAPILIFITCRVAKKMEKLEKELKDSIEVRDEFISLASHELKNPLAVLKLSFQLSKKSLTLGTLTKELVEKQINTGIAQIDKMESLIKDMLDLSVIRSGQLTFKPESLNLEKLVQEIVDRFIEAKITYRYDDGKQIIGKWDSHRIDQIVTNLLTNAIKYGEGKPIDVLVDADDTQAIIKVKDNGKGIAPKDREKIFQRFSRASVSDKIEGLGLGLYIVKKIVDAQKGKIEVESEVGVGSIFTVKLPFSDKLQNLAQIA